MNGRHQHRFGSGLLALGLVFGGLGVAGADEPQDIRGEIRDLQARLTTLETRLVEQERAIPPTGGEGLPQLLPGVQISGFVDTAYIYSFNEPSALTNTLRVFDTRSNGFMINAAELVLQKPVSPENPVGFRTDLFFGTDAEVVGSVTTGLGSTTNELDLQQAYVEFLAPWGNGVDFKVGKFVTLHGAEVIESKDNWNFSRSYLFGYAIPFTHTGLRASYQWTDWLLTCLGVSNGWDVVDDNNKGKTVEFSTTLTPTKDTFLTATYMFGPEQAFDNRDQRHLLDFVAGWNPTDKLSLKLNYDFGWEEDGSSEPDRNAQWQGVAAYARYQLRPWWAVAGRFEFLRDYAGVRTGLRLDDVELLEWTLTNEFKLYKDVIARLEYRHDQANSHVFTHDQGVEPYLDTVSVELIYPF